MPEVLGGHRQTSVDAAPEARRVILVEDDLSMRQAIARILRLAGFCPVTFMSAEQLLETGDAAGAACFVFDVHLPGLTGFELYERLARDGKPAPVIFISAYDEPASRRLAECAGAAAFLTKPFSGHDLVATVSRAAVA